MVAHLALVNAKHQSVEDRRRKVVCVNLAAFVGSGLVVALALVLEQEEVPIVGRGDSFIKE